MTQPDPRKIRVIAVINQRTGTVHGVTTDQETANHWLREVSDRHGPGSATQTADVVECTGQHYHPDLDTLFEQRDEAITERDALRAQVEAAQPVLDAASDYELAWIDYLRVSRMTTPARDAMAVLLAKGAAHQRLLDVTRAVDVLAASREETP